MTDKNYYITTPIYYVNGDPHLGHVYTTTAADVAARFKRLAGYNVHFLTGTDEHGQKVAQSAEKANVSPLAFCDEVSQKFRDVLEPFQISNDDFIRTTEERHKKTCQALWQKLEASGDIYLDKYAGWYAVRDEAYYGDDELTDGTDGDTKIAPSGAECKWVEEESYFFRLSQYGDKLLELYKNNPEFIGPKSSYKETLAFVENGLNDLSISRTTFDWGVPVPGNDKHVMYVWIDALTNYISALGHENGEEHMMDQYWPANVHLVGKEITRFHAIYWPAFLMSANLPVPQKIYANGWWVVEGEKMSKSLGNVIAPETLLERYGSDGSRYALLREMPFGNDGNFSHENAVNRINGDLANGLGNLAQRSLSMIAKNAEGKVPNVPSESISIETSNDEDNIIIKKSKTWDKADTALLRKMLKLPIITEGCINNMQIHKYLEAVWRVVGEANAYIDIQAPWKLKKEDPERMQTVLYVLAEVIRGLSIMAQPIIPTGANKILDQLAVPMDKRNFSNLKDFLTSGTELPAPQGVFPRLELDTAEAA
jgi:methionyl-tRNA synthetase